MAEYVAPRGTRDVLPPETSRWQYVESKFREMCDLYGFHEIRTPTFEHTELFKRNLGETTDVVSKEMYTFETRGGKSLTLRPEGTAPAIRAYVQNNLGAAMPVNKLYYIGRLFRYERPQAGRYREHTQLGMEAVGSADPAIDAEVISFVAAFFKSIGLNDYELKLNSIGCPECRPAYRAALLEYVGSRVGELCGTCAQRYETNPLRMLDCKEEGCKSVLADAPKLPDFLGSECSEHFETVKAYLAELGIAYRLDPYLVRGFDYYTKTAFEFVSGELGAQNAVGGGGRFDNLVHEIGGPVTPAIGFGLGLDRLMLTLDAMGVELPVNPHVSVFIVTAGEAAHKAAVGIVRDLREAGISADMDYTSRSLKAQMKTAGKMGVKYTIIIGDDEIANGTVTVKTMSASEQATVPVGELATVMAKGLARIIRD